MALGGLGTSTLEIGRDGAFQNIRVQNDWAGMVKPTPPGTFLSVHARTKGRKGVGRVLQLEAPEVPDALPEPMPDIPVARQRQARQSLDAVQGLTYTGRFPFVEIEYQDDALPCQVSLEAFSPFVPLDAESSSLPLVFFTFLLRNPGKVPVVAAAAISWTNNIAAESWNRGWPSEGNRNCLLGGDAPAVFMDTNMEEMAGSEYLLSCLPSKEVKYTAVSDWWEWMPGRWKGQNVPGQVDRSLRLWRRFLDRGCLPEEAHPDDSLEDFSPHQPVGAVAGEVQLAPGEEKEVRFALAWFFPYHYDRDGRTRAVNLLGHQYATRFPTGTSDVAAWAFPRRDSLREQSQAWRTLIEESCLPPHTRSLLTETLYLLPRISWWLEDGRFLLYESADCPRMHPTILDIYMAPVMAALFPELHAQALRNIADCQLDTGEIPSTLGINSIQRHEWRVFNTGDVSVFPITTTWEMLWGGDEEFVADLYPVMKKALQWGEAVLDEDRDGVPDSHGVDQGWDTFPMYGAATYIADQWMAALLAGEKMAQYLGDSEFARWCTEVRGKASQTVEKLLWNGSYYNLSYDVVTKQQSDIAFLDQFTYGTLAAAILELGEVHPAARIRQALKSLWRLNVEPAKFVARMGSNADGSPADCTSHREQEGGASQSNSFTPVSAAPFAAVAIQHGMVEEGLALVEEVSQIIINHVQEPWSGKLLFSSQTGEWFYGQHYSDCLIVWDVMYALLGVHVNMLERSLRLAPPRLPVKVPVFGRLYYGQVEFSVSRSGITLTLTSASDQPSLIRTLTVQLPGKVRPGQAVIKQGQAQTIKTQAKGVTVLRDVVIPPQGRLIIRWSAK